MMTTVTTVDGVEELKQIKRLWRGASATLGFFPDGAFKEYMERGWIIGAFEDQSCQGYLAFRISRNNAAIVHLCVRPEARGRGIARLLFARFRERTVGCQGATLRCRADFDANALWPRLGFVPVAESVGRNIEGKLLKTWWFDYGEPTLFSLVNDERRTAVIDANVFYDLQDEPSPANEESKALAADWLQEYVQLAVTDEIYGEIDRNTSKTERDRRRAFVSSFFTLQHNHELATVVEAELRDIIPRDNHVSTDSDRRQLAKAIAARADAFVTRDDRLLKLGPVIRRRWGIRVVRPVEVIIETDQLERADKYEPVRLAGTVLQSRLIKNEEIADLSQTFQNFPAREPQAAFVAALRRALSSPGRYESRLITSSDGKPLALEVTEQSPAHRDLQILRLCPGPLAGTLARHMVWRQVTEAAKAGVDLVICSDMCTQETAVAALREANFVEIDEGWGKVNLCGTNTIHDVSRRLAELELSYPWVRVVASSVEERTTNESAVTAQAVLEKYFWPLRLTDSTLPSFLVSIEPQWALHLFDERLAEQTLFGSEPSLALNVHNVYYRSARPRILRAPGRVLWYVSGRTQYAGSGHVRAVSTIDEVVTGTAKDLFKKYKRLGVYEWADVSSRFKGPNTEIMAFTFSGTQLFTRPIAWPDLQAVLIEEQHKPSQLQSPLQINGQCFEKLYLLGVQ